MPYDAPEGILIRVMTRADVDGIARTFARWHKGRAQYEHYWRAQRLERMVVLVALQGEEVVGYGTLLWASDYGPFRAAGIPEVADLNVMTEYQGRGIGTALLHAAERLAASQGKALIGISVEQSPAYSAADRLYAKLGYLPDGRGITAYDNELHLVKLLEPECTEGNDGIDDPRSDDARL